MFNRHGGLRGVCKRVLSPLLVAGLSSKVDKTFKFVETLFVVYQHEFLSCK